MPKAPIPMGALNFNPPLPETKASSKEVNLHPRFCVFLAVFHVLCDVMVHGAAFYLAFFRSPVYRTFNMLSFAHWEKFPVIRVQSAHSVVLFGKSPLSYFAILLIGIFRSWDNFTTSEKSSVF